MKSWIAKYSKIMCLYNHDGEPRNIAIFDWDNFPNREEFVGDVFGDSEEGDFEGMFDGDSLNVDNYTPFALINTSHETTGEQLAEVIPQFDGILLYRTGASEKDADIFMIDVDGTAIDESISEFGRLADLFIPTGEKPEDRP